jgi:hypothetical protein
MAVLHTLSAIGRFIRRTPPPPADLLEAYAHEVIPVMDRAEWLYEYWLEQATLFTDSEKLGNVAAIHRWETATMGRSLERVIPPSVLADAHERVIDALELASRAAQLLSSGSRFHNANAVCEGHAMLAVSRERRLAALRSMRRYLARVQPVASPEADPGSSEMLAEAAALVALGDDAPADATAVDGEQPVVAGDVELEPALADPGEPEPAWLSAARTAAAQTESTEDRADGPAASAEATDVRVDAPGDEPVHDPSDRTSWGSLFGKPPDATPTDQSGR